MTLKKSSGGKFRGRSLDDISPKSDWTWDELQRELDELAPKLSSPLLPRDNVVPNGVSPVSWRQLSITADFKPRNAERSHGSKRASFVMSLSDDELSGEDLSEDELKDDFPELAHAPSPCLTNEYAEVGGVSQEAGQAGLSATNACRHRSPPQITLRLADPVDDAILALEWERQKRVQEEIRERQAELDRQLTQESELEAQRLAEVTRQVAATRELLRRGDNQDQRAIAEARDQYLQDVQRQHAQRTQVGERLLRRDMVAAEEAAKQAAKKKEEELAAERKRQAEAEAQEKARAEEHASREAAARAAKIEQAAREKKLLAMAQQKANAEADQGLQAMPSGAVLATPNKSTLAGEGKQARAKVAKGAAQEESDRLQRLQVARREAQPFATNEGLKKERKALERRIILHVQQISATQTQVRRKTTEVLQLVLDPQLPQHFVAITFASKVLSQCESQVQKLPSFAFALAQVVVGVSLQVPLVLDILIGRLNEVCIYTVPKYLGFTKSKFASDEDYFRAVGYSWQEGEGFESTDSYVARMNAYVTFFAALLQVPVPGGTHPFGLAAGWAWCARLLNALPVNRATATALEAFLKVAGFRMQQEYPRPFQKLLHCVATQFLETLRQDSDPDSKAVFSRLDTYIVTRQFLRTPEGFSLPVSDASSQLRA